MASEHEVSLKEAGHIFEYLLVYNDLVFCTLSLIAAVQNSGFFPEAVLNLITNIGAGFTVRETAGMDISQLIAHVSDMRCCFFSLSVLLRACLGILL